MKVFLVICAVIGVVLSIRFIWAQRIEIPTISAEQIRELQSSEAWTDRSVIVDVRDKAETDVSVIPGAITKSEFEENSLCLLYTSPSPRDQRGSRMPSSA